jgi:hypothetical protein
LPPPQSASAAPNWPATPTTAAAAPADEPVDVLSAGPVDETQVASPRSPALSATESALNQIWSFSRKRGKCARNYREINTISLELVLRGTMQKCGHNPNEISAFAAELVLRDIPWKSA